MIKRITDVLSGKSPIDTKRSPEWPKARANHLTIQPFCQACGGRSKLEVHHIIPFHIRPDLELDPENLITLCEGGKYGINCHLFVGHKGDYSDYNSSVKDLAGFLFAYISKRTLL